MTSQTRTNTPAALLSAALAISISFSAHSQANIADGYAMMNGGTTGGQGGSVVRASTGTQIHAALCNRRASDTPIIIEVEGTIHHSNTSKVSGDSCNTADDKIEIKDVSNITLIGVGRGALFDQLGIHVRNASNIIIRNVTVRNVKKSGSPTSNGGDAIGAESNVQNLWVDHVTLEADGGESDGYDALFDIKAGTQYVTLSYSILRGSDRGGLVGSSETQTGNGPITWHHNIFDGLKSRVPLLRWGTGHIYNNLYTGIRSSGINVRADGEAKIENNYFVDSKDVIGTFYTDTNGDWEVGGNIFDNITWSANNGGDNRPAGPNVRSTASVQIPYQYNLDDATCVPQIVRATAGANTGLQTSDGSCQIISEPPAEEPPQPEPPTDNEGSQTITIQESQTGFCGVDGSVDQDPYGYTGSGFANTDNQNNNGIDWAFTGDAGEHTIRWRFANGSSANRSALLQVNGSSVSTEDFQSTGSWSSWNTQSVTLNLSGGYKDLRLVANQGAGLANIDYIEISGPNISAATCGAPDNNTNPEPPAEEPPAEEPPAEEPPAEEPPADDNSDNGSGFFNWWRWFI